ncbi:ABC transporter permease [Corynebacterium liangguodongii]|uniref:Multidrug ABC transporter permease n=1 Tax=Corynebacterium liangguodongii TaxID=2079535 RepID=A0A2S0WE36_9CORY|nr:ABC transporter permease [Corynebacterium liangguodongii]AWB84047.1 multidrug ABC transporter permease [Corynebacterium liangguodongii]PWC00058.1 multidrug ABC transporter permease [Corynebacterium liangguodongii]
MTYALPPGTFSPRPRRAPVARMALAQGRVEAALMLRHGEQLMLNLIIPAAILIAAAKLPLPGAIDGRAAQLSHLVPVVFAVAASSAGFTGQAIALAFDRRYGALKRAGASGVPAWTIIAGKILGVLAMVAVQIIVLGALALALGWRVSAAGAAFGALTLLLGVACFTALGLLMGGSLSSELVLALANLAWLALVGTLGYVAYVGSLASAGWFNAVPTVALAGALSQAFVGVVDSAAWIALVAWAVLAVAAAVRWFRFDG